MPLIIPNAGDTTGGNKYEALDQAEPDALDFEILSYDGSGVFNGVEVTTNNSASTVSVSAGIVVLNGVSYSVSANAALGIPTAPADNRFDMVVARVSAGVASLVVVQGENSGTNPAYPKSASVITGAPSPTTNVDFSTDVVLAALYRSGAQTVTSSRIVDKRVIRTPSIFFQGATSPLSSQGAGTGTLYYKTTAPSGTESGVWIKKSNGEWIELAQNVGPHLPVGAVVAWPAKASLPVGCLEFNGQALATNVYPDLFSVYGYDHGGSGGTFNLPNWNTKYLIGTTSTSLIGSGTVGLSTITLALSQLPSHDHSLSSHTHVLSHTHGIDHTHAGTNTGSTAPSAMTGSTGGSVANPRLWINGSSYYDSVPNFQTIVDYGGWPTSGAPGVMYGDPPGGSRLPPSHALWFGPESNRRHGVDDTEAHTHTVTVSAGGSHAHSISVPTFNGSTVSQSGSTTSGPNTSTTGLAGSGQTIDNRPLSEYTRWIVRATLGIDAGAVGNPSPNQNVFSMSKLVTTTAGEKYLWVAAFDCQIDTVRAWRLDGTTLTVNVRINNATDALVSDLSATPADTWVSAVSSASVAAGQLVEVEVVTAAGFSEAYVQVDFSS